MSVIQKSSLLKWLPNPKDFSHFGRFQHSYGTTVPNFPTTLGRVRRTILDQGITDECTDYQGAVRSGYRFGKDFSRKYQGAKESELMGSSIINGADPRTAMKVPLTFGSLPLNPFMIEESDAMPKDYLDWTKWPLSLDKLALPYLESAYNLVDGPYDHFDNIRTVLQQAFAENEVVLVFSSWFPEWNQTRGIIPIPTSVSDVNHAHLFVDFQNVNAEPMLVDHLSQGTEFGDNGFAYFNRDVVNQQVENGNMACYIFRVHPSQQALLQTLTELEGEAIDLAQRVIIALLRQNQ